MSKDFDNVELVAKARQGDKNSLNELSDLVQVPLRSYIYRLSLDHQLTEDVLQETLVEMVKNLSGLEVDSKFWPWMRKIAANKFYRMKKKDNKHNHRSTDSIEQPSHSFDGLAHAITEEWKTMVTASLKDLTPRYRQILTLRCYEQMGYSDIAKEMDTNEFNVRLLFFRAKRSLAKHLSKKGLTKSALPAALMLFGYLSAGSEVAAANIAIGGTLLKVGATASTVGVVTCKSFIISAITLGVLAVSTTEVVENYKDSSPSDPHLSVGMVDQNKPTLKRNARDEFWYCYPPGGDGSVMIRQSRGGKCQVLQNGEGNYYCDGSTVRIENYRSYNSDLSVRLLPDDDVDFLRFIEQMQGYSFLPIDSVERQYDGMLVIASVKDDHVHSVSYDHINADQEGYFKSDWPAGSKIVDNRDKMHRRGFTYFELKGAIDDEKISGSGRLAFSYSQSQSVLPWVTMEKAGKRWVTYDLVGFSRPWQGLHTIDTIRRDAAKSRIVFETNVAADKALAFVVLKEGNNEITYTIDLKKDLVTRIEFAGDVTGQIEFDYHQDISAMESKFKRLELQSERLKVNNTPLWEIAGF